MALGISAIFMTAIFVITDPIAQINKALDAQRKTDLKNINTALDIYYNDNDCFPYAVPFGAEWKDEATGEIYMKKVPQDPVFNENPAFQYVYDNSATSPNTCSRWNVLFGKLAKVDESQRSSTLCPLEAMKSEDGGSCLPSEYFEKGYNFCIVSGTVDCTYLASSTVFDNIPSDDEGVTPTVTGEGGGGLTSTPQPTATPTATPTSLTPTNTPTNTPILSPTPTGPLTPTPTPCSKNYVCTPGGSCNVSGIGLGDYCSFQECIENSICDR